MGVRQLSITITSEPASVADARRFVALGSSSFGEVDQHALALATSEVVANAVSLAAGDVTVTLRPIGDVLRIDVRDDGFGMPELSGDLPPPDVDHAVEVHFGLAIVDRLALAWGVEQFLPGKIVWFELPLAAGPADRETAAGSG